MKGAIIRYLKKLELLGINVDYDGVSVEEYAEKIQKKFFEEIDFLKKGEKIECLKI